MNVFQFGIYLPVALFSLVIIGFLVFPFCMICLSFLSPKRNKIVPSNPANEQTHFACIITVYQNIQIALPAVEALLKSKYDNYHIYLVADNCKAEHISNLPFNSQKVTVLVPPVSFHAKVKSIQFAVEHFKYPHTHCLIFDADNLAAKTFLATIHRYIAAGYQAVQGRRTAKNLNTPYACADAMGELYKNYIERYVPYLLGSSATIAGSGMAVETGLFIRFLQSPAIYEALAQKQVIVAEDKMLQNFLATQNVVIAFANDAIVYDEKVTQAAQVKRQRTRWLYAYFQNLPHALNLVGSGLLGANLNRLIMGMFSLIPPMFLLLATACLLTVANILLLPVGWALAMAIAIAIFGGTILWTLYLSQAPLVIWQSLWVLPAFVLNQFLSLLQIRKAKYNFLTTSHTHSARINEVESKNR